jgi:hypothetical protein
MASTLSNLLAGRCGASTPGGVVPVGRVDFHDIADVTQLQQLLRLCPVVITSATHASGGDSLASWNWEYLQRTANAEITFDLVLSSNRRFTYWDNSSLLGASMSQRGHEQQHASSSQFMQAAVADDDDAGGTSIEDSSTPQRPAVRFGGPLSRFSERASRELRASPSGRTLLSHLGPPSPPLASPLPLPGAYDEEDSTATSGATLFVGSANVTSTAHFDNFANTHIVLSGHKQILLTPPSSAFAMRVRPGSHPEARQARCSLERTKDAAAHGRGDIAASPPSAAIRIPSHHHSSTASMAEEETAEEETAEEETAEEETVCMTSSERVPVLAADLREGDALFIPPGWIHEVRTLRPSAALSLTAQSAEWLDFNHWARHERRTLVPFLSARAGASTSAGAGAGEDAGTRRWTHQRFASTLLVFIPELCRLLGLASDGSVASTARFLHSTWQRQYGKATRREAGLHWPPFGSSDDAPAHQHAAATASRLPTGRMWACEAAEGADAHVAREAAQPVAQRLLERYRPELQPLFLMLYLENILPMVLPASLRGLGVRLRLSAMLAFVDSCLLSPPGHTEGIPTSGKEEL